VEDVPKKVERKKVQLERSGWEYRGTRNGTRAWWTSGDRSRRTDRGKLGVAGDGQKKRRNSRDIVGMRCHVEEKWVKTVSAGNLETPWLRKKHKRSAGEKVTYRGGKVTKGLVVVGYEKGGHEDSTEKWRSRSFE